MVINKIFGTINLTDSRNPNYSGILLGGSIELSLPIVEASAIPGRWLGYSTINNQGEFSIFPAIPLTEGENVLISIFKGEILISREIRPLSEDLSLSIDVKDLDPKLPDNTAFPNDLDYIIIHGKVFIGSLNIRAIPIDDQAILIKVNKSGFRQTLTLTQTLLDRYGNYTLKIPTRLLYSDLNTFSISRLPEVFLTVVSNDDVTFSVSLPFNLNSNHINMDIQIESKLQSLTNYFEPEILGLSHLLTLISGLDPEDFHTITEERYSGEIEVLASTSDLSFSELQLLLTAFKIAKSTQSSVNHCYAVIKNQGLALSTIFNLTEAEFCRLVEEAESNFIIPHTEDSIDDTYNALQQLKLEETYKLDQEKSVTLLNLFKAFLTSEEDCDTFLKLYLNFDNESKTITSFWDEVGLIFNEHQKAQIQKGFQLLAITGMQPELTEFLAQELVNEDLEAVLPHWDITQWYKIITILSKTHKKLCVPSVIKEKYGRREKRAIKMHYAFMLFSSTTSLFTNQVLIDYLEKDKDFADLFEDVPSMVSFLLDNSDFDFRKDNVWQNEYLSNHPQLRADLIPLQNLVRLTNSIPILVVTLLKMKIRCSADLTSFRFKEIEKNMQYFLSGKEKGISEYFSSILQTIYQKANRNTAYLRQAYVSMLPGSFIEKATQNWSKDIWVSKKLDTSIPDFESLFGRSDFCSCASCNSLLSPGAYFTDLLNFIKFRLSDHQIFDELSRRRPDLAFIDISCKNANMPMPYIDLVNELLELIILNDPNDPQNPPLSFQTNSLEKELSAHPEHCYKIDIGVPYEDYKEYVYVYNEKLNQAIYPNTLPFNLALEECRVYLGALKANRLGLMDKFKPTSFDNFNSTAAINLYNFSAEILACSKFEADIIAKEVLPTPTTLEQFYGSPQSIWYETLCEDLPQLLRSMQIDYISLLQLLTTDFLNQSNAITQERPFAIVSKPGYAPDTCAIEELMLQCSIQPDMDAKLNFFDKFHRFIRLQRATKWTIAQLDIVLASFSFSDIDKNAFIIIGQVKELTRILNSSPESLTCIWNQLNTNSYPNFNSENQATTPSFYQSVFQNKTLVNPADPNFVDPQNIVGSYQENMGTIIAALRISEEEVNRILDFMNVDVNAQTQLNNLSKLFAVSLIAQKLDYSIIDLLRIYALLELTIDATQPPGSQFSILKILFIYLNELKCLVFKLPELEFLLANLENEINIIPKEKAIQQFYENLRSELLLESKNVDWQLTPQPSSLVEILLQRISNHFDLSQEVALLLLSDLLVIANESVLDKIINPAFIESIEPIVYSGFIPGLNFADLYDHFYRLNKLSLIIKKLKLSAPEIKTLYRLMYKLDIAVLQELPIGIEPNNQTRSLLDSLLRLNSWIRVRDLNESFKDNFTTLLFYATGMTEDGNLLTKDDWQGYVSTLLDSALTSLVFLTGDNNNGGVLEMNYVLAPNDNSFKDAKRLLQINEILSLKGTIGLSIENIFATLTPQVLTHDSQNIRKAAKSKYEQNEWVDKAKPLQDKLRKKQRDALTDYVLANHSSLLPFNQTPLRNRNDLYAYLLIDSEMEPCMLTSRIKQGIGSLQLFMDRLLLQIESLNGANVLLVTESEAKQWRSWRKWYRVWEANRKVFFYPENWLEPELRDDKSNLFKDLELQLMQQEITEEAAEKAILGYLDGLEEVANLEPVSVYKQVNPNILHVFGRSHSDPQVYYYRTLNNKTWSAWERIDADVKGNHITPVMWNGRLYLFWLSFTKKKPETLKIDQLIAENQPSSYNNKKWIHKIANPTDGLVDDQINNNRFNEWEIRLQWSQFQNGKWSSSDLSKDVMVIDFHRILLNNSAIQTYSDAQNSQNSWNFLTKKNEIEIDDFFKNRIYLSASFESNNEEDGINFNLLFPGGWDENAIGLHTFLWKGDNSKEPFVLRGNDRGHQMIAPLHTKLDKMKFVADQTLNEALYKDGYIKIYDGYYTYSGSYYFDNNPIIIRAGSTKILTQTPNGAFSVYSRAKNSSNHLDNPMEDLFFFEDAKNCFFVQKEAERSYSYTLSIQNKNLISLAAITQFVNINYANQFNPSLPTVQSGILSGSSINHLFAPAKYRFRTFYHPQINRFKSLIYNQGVSGLLSLTTQYQQDNMAFGHTYKPTHLVHSLYPQNNVQFDYNEAYGSYNWELFFHAPMMIAERLSHNLKFEEAQRWYHYIFNPTGNTDIHGNIISDTKRFWKFYPFYEIAGQSVQTLNELLMAIYQNMPDAVAEVQNWENNPFQPFSIARMRKLAFMKNVLMKYLDNLIAWADQLYQSDTLESINEATQLYILAANILGERPQEIPPRVKKDIRTFEELVENGPLDLLSNTMVTIESFFSPNAGPDFYLTGTSSNTTDNPKMILQTMYFCLPQNEKMLHYWDIVADRLFKIRNCMDIDGAERVLPLYEPPIDPALLVRATALGLDISTALNSVQLQKPNYRFTYILQKANEFVTEVRNLGASLLQTLEKKDAEGLSLLRSGQEIQLLSRIHTLKEMQVHEAQNAIDILNRTKELVTARLDFYSSRTFINNEEGKHLAAIEQSTQLQVIQSKLQAVSSVWAVLPQVYIQGPFSIGPSFGGQHLSAMMNALSAGVGIDVARQNHKAQTASLMGGYVRRQEDWDLQIELAQKELAQIDTQILGAQINFELAKKELANHELQMDQAQEVDRYMRDKYTNEQLYQWMIGQLSATYFQSYYLARNLAQKAEQCFKFELPLANIPTQGFISFNYWDNLKKGLLSGEQLQFDLRKMDAAYIDENKRELELTKHISLAALDPQALVILKNTGSCMFKIPEFLFDLDYPGHYLRRIKSISISIPCIAGPYTTISCTLEQKNSKYRLLLPEGTDYKEEPVNGDSRFTYFNIGDTIATSSAQNDNGLFELNFRDERYLPFENTGAISEWGITFPDEFRQFDYQSINDIIIHLNYTAKDAGSTLKEAATTNLHNLLQNSNTVLYNYLSIRHGFSKEWLMAFKALVDVPGKGTIGRGFDLPIAHNIFPELCRQREIVIPIARLFRLPKKQDDTTYWIVYGSGTAQEIDEEGVALQINKTIHPESEEPFEFILYKEENGLPAAVGAEDLSDLFLVLYYSIN